MTTGKRILRTIAAAAAVAAAGTLLARALGYKLGANTVVRCRDGHLFTTIWVPGIKLKAIDLGVARFQFCPVGRHWSVVTPVKEADLDAAALAAARAHHDIRIP